MLLQEKVLYAECTLCYCNEDLYAGCSKKVLYTECSLCCCKKVLYAECSLCCFKKVLYAECIGTSSYLIVIGISSCLRTVEKDLLCLLGEFEQHDSNMFCTKCYTNVMRSLTIRFAVAKFSAKFNICEQLPLGACTLKHYEFVIYGKWSDFAVS
jgi:hypothetical protein